MHSSTLHQRSSAKQSAKSTVPYPSLITQVTKDDDQKYQSRSFSLGKCCSYLWKCLPLKKENFDEINESSTPALLEPQLPEFKGRKVLVLDLDETLVHSTFEPVQNPDIILPVHINGQTYKINVLIRPGTEEFLARVQNQFEVVVFTASLPEYAEPLVKKIDPTGSITSLLFRQHCTPLNGIYVKDMSIMGRDIKDIILVDNSPNSFLFQPENAYHIKNFFDDKTDRELDRLTAFLDNIVDANVHDVRPIAELRKTYEPKEIKSRAPVFVKTNTQAVEQEQSSAEISAINVETSTGKRSQFVKAKKDDREKVYNIETEPDLRREKDDGNEPLFASRAAPLTDRGTASDGPENPEVDCSEDNLELPSPKESDNLINHRQADAYFDKKTDETDLIDRRRSSAMLLKSNQAGFSTLKQQDNDYVTVEEPILDGQKVDNVRFLTNCENLNSPLGRHVKIEFNGENQEIEVDL